MNAIDINNKKSKIVNKAKSWSFETKKLDKSLEKLFKRVRENTNK